MTATLGAVCKFLNGGTPSKEVIEYFDGDIPWITSADISGPVANYARSFITVDAVKNSAVNKVPAGSVLLVTRTGVGKVAIAATELCFSQDITALIPDTSKLEAGYLVHFLRTKKEYFMSLARGATIKGITRNVVSDLSIPLPSLPEQRRIAAILDKVDAIRFKRCEALAHLENLMQSIFIEMFGDLTKNTKEFNVQTLGDLCDVRDGTHDSPKFVTVGFPLVTTRNLHNGCIDFSAANLISEADYIAINKRSKVDKGDILMPMIGTIGNPVLVKVEPNFAIKNMALIKFKDNSPDKQFILNFLKSDCFLKLIKSKSKGGTQKFLPLGAIRAIGIPVPPRSLQAEFSSAMKTIQHQISLNSDSLSAIDDIFLSIRHRAFRGEL